MKPGRYSLRIAAQSASANKSGSVFYDLEITLLFSRALVAFGAGA